VKAAQEMELLEMIAQSCLEEEGREKASKTLSLLGVRLSPKAGLLHLST